MHLTSMRGKPLECVELRQYALHLHKRDVLIDLFDREFVETQEAAGVTVMGQVRDIDDPNLFVWLRGFESMQARLRGLIAGGAQAQRWYVTEPRENDFRRLPVRENEQVLMGVAVFPDGARSDDFGRSNLWASEIAPELRRWPLQRTETHRLAPTARSATHA